MNINSISGNIASALNTPTYWFVRITLGTCRGIYGSAKNVFSNQHIQDLVQVLDSSVNLTRFFDLTKAILALPNIPYKAAKALRNHGWKRFDHLMKAVGFTSTTCDGLSSVASALDASTTDAFFAKRGIQWAATACRVAAVAAAPLAAVGAALSVAFLVNHAREFYRTRKFKQQFLKLEGEWRNAKDKKRLYTQMAKYKEIKKLIKSTSDTCLRRYFDVNGPALRQRLAHLDKQPLIDRDEVFEHLRGRIQKTLRNETLQVALDIVQTASTALILANLWNPVGFALLGGFCVGQGIFICYKMVKNYQFERSIGLIEKNHAHSNQIVDFVKWALHITPKFDAERLRLNALRYPESRPAHY